MTAEEGTACDLGQSSGVTSRVPPWPGTVPGTRGRSQLPFLRKLGCFWRVSSESPRNIFNFKELSKKQLETDLKELWMEKLGILIATSGTLLFFSPFSQKPCCVEMLCFSHARLWIPSLAQHAV